MNRVSVGPRILETVGNTDMIELGVPKGSARILMKLESQNPTGSMKDRMALAMIEAAEMDGRLQPGGHVVEYTAGSTGVSLAMVCAAKGYDLSIVTSDAFSLEKRNHMAAFGARLTVLPSVDGRMDEALTRGMIQAAHDIRDRVDGYLTDQLRNADQLPAYHRMGEEIWSQTGGRMDAFVQMTGTAASSRGVSEALHSRDSSIFCVAVEPSESAVLSGGPSGSHRIEGVGAGFVAPLWDPDAVDDVATVSTEDAMNTARDLAREEALCAGTSTGGNLFTARALARELGPDAVVVTVMCDSGSKYLTTELYGKSSPTFADG